MGQKVRLNEAQLKRIIAESVKKTINELFDTLPGIKTGTDIAMRGNEAGRYGQSSKVTGAIGNSLKEKFGDNILVYSSKRIVYKNAAGDYVSVDTGGNLFYVDVNAHYITSDKVKFGTEDAKTDNRNVARIIAKWCDEHITPFIEEYADWHKWALL
jgi:hypothetical protein